jgi:hypothetical protein
MKLFIFATITILFQAVWSYYFETDASNTCTAGHSDLTKARQCDCTGGIQEPCDNCFGVWGSMCYDLENPPSCAQNQVLFEPAGPQLVNAGGNCYPSITDCPWLKLNYTWTCCNCPKGTIGKHQGACDQMYSIGTFCVGCTNPKETLTGNEQIGYSCSLTCAAGASTGTNLEPCGASETSGQRGSCPVNTWCAPNLGPQDNCPGNAGCAMNNRGINLLKSFEKGCPYIYTINGHGTIGMSKH